MAAMTATTLMEILDDAGVLPPNCKAVTIRLAFDAAAELDFACYGDDQTLKGDDLVEIVRTIQTEVIRNAPTKTET